MSTPQQDPPRPAVASAGPAGPTGLEIVEVTVPTSLDAPDAWPVHATVAVSQAVDLGVHGNVDTALDAEGVVAGLLESTHRRIRRFVATLDGEPVGRGFVLLPLTSNTHRASVQVSVVPSARRRGVGTALWGAVERVARDAGRTALSGDSPHSPEPSPGPGALEPTTGVGRAPADDAGVRFALRHGFTLEQVARHSVLDLPVDPGRLAGLVAVATAAAGPGYRVHVWADEIPEEHLDGLAVLETRMSTDAPSGGLDLREDPWDADRVRAWFAQVHDREAGYVVCAVEHVPTGALAGFTVVTFPEKRPPVVFQEDTLVLREHCGHRLGMLVKATLLAELARTRPAAERVHTWNAQENDAMLAINVALGFRPAGIDAEWQRVD